MRLEGLLWLGRGGLESSLAVAVMSEYSLGGLDGPSGQTFKG